MDTAIKTYPEAAKKCLVNWPLCTSPRDNQKPIIQHIAAQIQRWENEIPKSELTAKPSRSNRSNSVKHVDPVPVPRIPTHAKSATSNYFKVIGAICIAMALIAWVMAQVVTTGPTSCEFEDSPPINRLQFISTQPSEKEIETHAHRTPALRQALLIQSLHGTRLATDVPMVVRALSAKFDRISNPVHFVMQDG
ncbi:hypothetical protein EBR57_07540 [bacterium]|nr:hypothetical protein [bacterium]